MGKIKKVATERHTATLSPFVEEFVKQAASEQSTSLHQLPRKLAEFPQQWPFPRGDLYHWIPLLDRFDNLLETFNKEYQLNEGPQTQPFERRLLQRSRTIEGQDVEGPDPEELDGLGYSEDGDREVVESVVHFTRILHEHCGNRSLYASSGHINDLLNSTSLSLVRLSLKLALRLAQRYQVARYKSSSTHAQSMLMANHYNFNLDNLQKIAMPFAKHIAMNVAAVTPGKGKEKASQAQLFNPSDLVTLAKEPHTLAAKGDIGAVNITYYDQAASGTAPKQASAATQPSEALPSTPTPARRTSNLGPSRDRPSADRSDSTPDVTPVKSRDVDSSASSAPKAFNITSTKVAETPAWALLREALPSIPTELRYELLNRIRIAKALTSPEIPTQQLLEARLLAIANLSYSLGESKFQEKIGIPDNEEPRRFHLAQQLCDLLQPATEGQVGLSLETETTVIHTLEALLKSRHKIAEVIDALAITVNHGVLYYELRKVIATLHVGEHADPSHELRELEWRDATFDLIHNLQVQHSQSRVGEKMVAAGVMSIMVEVLSLRTSRAERFHERVLGFFASFIHNLQNAMQTFATDKGFDILADLTQYEVDTALQQAKDGKGLREDLRSKVVDYTISYGQQSTLRQLLKFIVQMFDNSGGTHDRLLRNLVDTPQILGALKTIILDWKTFGSNIWKEAVNIMSAFIHNEPTSYQVVGEAGLPRALLQTLVGHELPEEVPPEFTLTEADLPGDVEFVNGEPQWPEVAGILPVEQSMVDIPGAFGAICLNENGMQLFQSSKALIRYFDIFVSPTHVKALVDEDMQNNGAYGIGAAFDELSRHQPRLKEQIVMVVCSMVKRVGSLSRGLAEHKHNGAKLWKRIDEIDYEVDGGSAALAGLSQQDFEEARENDTHIDLTSRSSRVTSKDIPHALDETSDALRFITACARFLEGFFHNGGHNGGMCTPFCESGGAEAVLDLVTAPSNPVELPTFGVYKTFGNILKLMSESKAHLVLPSMLRRLQNALLGVAPVTNDSQKRSIFQSYGDRYPLVQTPFNGGRLSDGTTVLKCLSNAQILSDLVAKILEPPKYTSRHSSQTSMLFTNLNFTEVYMQLVDELIKLRANCYWEDLGLLRTCSDDFKKKSNPDSHQVRRIDVNGRVVLAFEKNLDEARQNSGLPPPEQKPQEFAIKNAKAIRYLLHITPLSITKFIHHLGQSLMPRRSNEVATKQHASVVAERIAKSSLWELDYRKLSENTEDAAELEYVAVVLQPITSSMVKVSFAMHEAGGPKEALTLVLNKFYLNGGFDKLNGYLHRFGEVRSGREIENTNTKLFLGASHGLNAILDFYATVVRQKTIVDAIQSPAIAVRDHRQGDYFMPGQFVVEIRNVVLPAVDKLWSSSAIDSMSETAVKRVIDIMRVILKSEGEDRALKRSDNASRRVMATNPDFALKNEAGVAEVQNDTIDFRLAREAIYRCNNSVASARDYANLRVPPRDAPRFPIPAGESSSDETAGTEVPSSSQRSVDMTDADQEDENGDGDEDEEMPELEEPAAPMTMTSELGSEDAHPNTLDGLPANVGDQDLLAMVGSGRLQSILNLSSGGSTAGPADASSAAPPSKDTRQPFVTVEDLEEKRVGLRDSLIDRCLEVLSAVPGVTFELADLIQAAVAKSGEGANPRADIGSTLVSSLMSLQADEPSKEAGVKIAAYAHLVALILQDRDFFISTMDELKEYLDALIGWVHLAADQKAEDAPWLEMVLLIIERMLAEDEQPVELKWDPPPLDDPLKPLADPELPEPVVPDETRATLFNAVVDVLPKIGKNTSLALSVSRVLVMLTRRRDFALRLSEKQSIGRLFLMVRQLAGSVTEKLHSSFMLILRHLVEDEQMIRQIMQTEIKLAFEGSRSSRAMDTSTYTRNLHHLVLRDPKMFIEVTKDMVEVGKFDGNPNRAQTLALKKETPAEQLANETAATEVTAAAEVTAQGVQSSVESDSKAKDPESAEVKPPVVESPDGVVSFLLRELSNYKDVDERPSATGKDTQPAAQANGDGETDVDMVDASATATPALNGTPAPASEAAKSTEKPVFKAEEHSIYIYRCFILQCLSELLSSYDRTKIEFINFSRKPETQPATPAKPRAGTLNYLLNTLIPVGTLEHRDDIAYRKKLATSNWAATLIVSLCQKTPERNTRTPRTVEPLPEADSDLSFVRKFIYEHALRCFKEATTSTEPLDQRYSRLLALGELFGRLLNKTDRDGTLPDPSHKQQVGRIMYEKGYIAALTSAIAELDLNFPNAKRAVKYILSPLRQLTDLGVELSQTSDLSASSAQGTSTDEDEVSSATSVSEDEDDEREQTPDLLRNTALGVLESGGDHDEESSDEEDDEDDEGMEYDEYDEMDYEEEAMPEHGDVVSDDEEGAGGMGDIEGMPGDVNMDVEIVMNGEGDENDMDEDDDDDEEEDDEDDMDDEEFPEHIDEITGDDENGSLADGDEGEWEEDEGEFDADAGEDGSPHGGPLDHIARVIGADDPSDGEEQGQGHLVRVDMGDGPEDYFEDEMPPEDEDEEDEEVDFEHDVAYEPEIEEEDDDEQDLGWDFDAPAPPPGLIRAPHHHHHGQLRGFGGMFDMLGGGEAFRPTGIRSHRAAAGPRAEDEGVNPLLQRDATATTSRDRGDGGDASWSRLGLAGRPRAFPPVDMIQDLVASVAAGGNRTINVNLGDIAGLRARMPGMFPIHGNGSTALIDIDPSRPWADQIGAQYLGGSRGLTEMGRSSAHEEAQAVEFHVTATLNRWQEEARLLFGSKHHEKATRVNSSLLRLLVPPAMQTKLEQDREEVKRQEAARKARAEELEKAEAEKAEREAQEKKEREEQEAREREEAQREQEAQEAEVDPAGESVEEGEMEGVEQTHPTSQSEEAAAPEAEQAPAPRVVTTIRGREVDITSLGIDRDFLDAIPEDMREEVIMAQLQEQRSQAVQAGEQPSEISREFLEALPREIQQELLRQEASDRRRRERQEAQREAAQAGNAQPAQPEEMNNADFMAMLDPGLRQTILMDADENTLAALPEEVQAEARALLGDRLPPRAGGAGINRREGGLARVIEAGGHRGPQAVQAAREIIRQRRPIVQMLDKAGVATLLRLMFVSLHHKAKSNLHSILSDVCKNTQNRAEVISILLSILQDGTADMGAVERSFAQLSLKAKQLSGPKTPQPLKRTPTGLAAAPTTELSPLNIVQHCLSTLRALSEDNTKVPSFFLTEHETVTVQKGKTPKKGKGRESKAAKYPLNALLALLDRKLITENTGVMEILASLLSRVTQPLTILLRRAKEAQEAEKPKATEPASTSAVSGEVPAGGDVPMEEAPAAEASNAPSTEAAQNGQATESQLEVAAAEGAKKPEAKKSRELTPPEVPEENIRLVVNILAARECPTKTFSDTVDIIKNLSAIPGAKEVFGRELVRQAQELAQTVLEDLETLAKQINSAETSTDLQGLALANFSSAGSKQRMLLRVILALDHLFDPKRNPHSPTLESPIDPKLKDDVLALLYDSGTFGKLWNNLSSCLAAIRARGNMVNVATILLPLIESLMVVCRNSSVTEAPQSAAVTSPTSEVAASTPPPPDSTMEGLFFRFTEDNRKILNELIRNNPKLMGGQFSILAKNSKVLEFDNKRTYFSRKLHNRGEVRVPHPSLQLSVRREHVFLDSFKSLYYKNGDEIKYGKLNIRFHGEEGIDAGGVSREWFAAMARQMFNPDYALFVPVASDRTTFHPNELSDINTEHLLFFKFIGRIIGKALYENRVLDCHFSRAVYRRILGKSVSLKDMESLDLDYYKSLVWLLENDITDIAFQTFSIDVDRFGASETHDLVPGGRDISVTEENKQEYVQRIVEYRLIEAVGKQLDNFLEGFHEIIPKELIAIFNEQELELLISGLPEIDVDDWKNNTEYHNYQPTSPQIQWFWRAVRSFDKEEKAKLLQFVTGTSKVPLNGFKELEGMNGFAKFNIHRDYSSKQKLPSSHTCFNQLDLPEYETYEHMRQQMYTAITAGSEYFGFA